MFVGDARLAAQQADVVQTQHGQHSPGLRDVGFASGIQQRGKGSSGDQIIKALAETIVKALTTYVGKLSECQ